MSKFIDLNDKSRASNCYSRLNEDAKIASNIKLFIFEELFLMYFFYIVYYNYFRICSLPQFTAKTVKH